MFDKKFEAPAIKANDFLWAGHRPLTAVYRG